MPTFRRCVRFCGRNSRLAALLPVLLAAALLWPASAAAGTFPWSFTGSLNKARGVHTATLLPNGKVLVAGGRG